MLSDTSGKATALYTYIDEARNGPFPSIFIADRYGELRKQEIANEADQLLSEQELVAFCCLRVDALNAPAYNQLMLGLGSQTRSAQPLIMQDECAWLP